MAIFTPMTFSSPIQANAPDRGASTPIRIGSTASSSGGGASSSTGGGASSSASGGASVAAGAQAAKGMSITEINKRIEIILRILLFSLMIFWAYLYIFRKKR
jgi:hypothetical protein